MLLFVPPPPAPPAPQQKQTFPSRQSMHASRLPEIAHRSSSSATPRHRIPPIRPLIPRNAPRAPHRDELVLERRPRRQAHGDGPQRVAGRVMRCRERERVVRSPGSECRVVAGELDGLADGGAF